ncbi:MAG: hypothetical protein HETSPECPRED_002348 [Heterodermia speciosa]|uniref:Secreted protein n=1 Tax=Heterodermia speciosa TaxID=116794 RepID=A0A8H3IE90_9LECA|nr:MAG: hypothetical protein HETSPECPRED_002348 [Heterodermia speciosa]
MICAIPLVLFALIITVTCDDKISCWGGGPRSKLRPTTFKACRAVIKWLGSHDKEQGPITFSRRPGVGYRVPDQWLSGNCVVSIDMHSDDDVDTLSFREIAVEAYTIALGCVISPPHLGGDGHVGPKGVMNVTILGVDLKPDGPAPLIRHYEK